MRCVIISLFLLLVCWSVSAQDISSSIEEAGTLTSLLKSIEEDNLNQLQLLQNLQTQLVDSDSIIETQSEYLRQLSKDIEEQGRIYERQLEYQNDLRSSLSLYKLLFWGALIVATASSSVVIYNVAF